MALTYDTARTDLGAFLSRDEGGGAHLDLAGARRALRGVHV